LSHLDPDLRVLFLAPTHRDRVVANEVLERAGVAVEACGSLPEVIAEAERGVAAILLPEEAVMQQEPEPLIGWLSRQPAWSDLPVLVLARTGAASATVASAMDRVSNLTILERPLRVSSLVSAIRTALRSRRRQYQTREHLLRIEASEAELRDFFENAAVGLHVLDRNGVVLRVNRTELAMLGYNRDEFVGHPISEFHTDPEVIDEATLRLRLGQKLSHYEARLVCRDGSVKDVLIDSSALWEEKELVRVRCFTRDVTDRKRAEEALREADRRKDEFLAILAHELRNPLAPIRNSLHVLRLTSRSDPTAERVSELMERQVNQMVRLVDDLFEVSRITRGKIELRQERIEIAAVLRGAVETSRSLVEASHHQLRLDLPAEPLTIEGDPVRLTQVFANLLNNAAKYTPEGGRIDLEVRGEGDHVVVSIRDTGAGIAPEMLSRVFDPFTQGNRSKGTSLGGLGIGLTLVKMLVELHGGGVEAHSAGPGQGSEFIVKLRLVQDVAPADPEPVLSTVSGFPPLRILVVDDNQDSAASLGLLLRLLGADTYAVFSGAEALRVAGTYQPDVVLLDIGMPDMDGHEVARRLRQSPEGRHVKLIALTGWGQEQDRIRSKLAGFDHHLIKPADVGALEALLDSFAPRRARHVHDPLPTPDASDRESASN
jgi:PAS domain S-box-containing protein